jgi:hypothetical protein
MRAAKKVTRRTFRKAVVCSCDHDVSSWSRTAGDFGARAARGRAAGAGAKLADYPVLAGGLDHRYTVLTVGFN